MLEADRVRIQHMIDAANEALSFVDIVWQTLIKELPQLLEQMQKLMPAGQTE